MGKVSGSYESVVRGVSEQIAQDRRSGQHTEVVNMLSDPVRGLARRHGTLLEAETAISGITIADAIADTVNHRAFTFFIGGVEYDLIYRTVASAAGAPTFLFAYNKATKAFLPVSYAEGDTTLDTLISGGVSSVANVGKYLFIAGNTIVPSWTPTDNWGSDDNKSKLAVWFRGGAYARTFSITVTKTDGTAVSVSYKTKTSSYATPLDTSDIPVLVTDTDPSSDTYGQQIANPQYQKLVNDRTNAYNGEVTAWIIAAAEDIAPASLASTFATLLAAQGINATATSSTVCIDDASVAEVSADDGGDQTLARAVGNQITEADLVSATHYVGKFVKVRPKHSNGDDAYYLKAEAAASGTTGWAEVYWTEAPGYVMQPVDVFCLATVKDETLYIGSNSTYLEALTGDTHPAFKANAVGDDITCPLPQLFGNGINYLGVFQDRLVICSGATVLLSRPGDYFNWFRESVLTVVDTDPWEGYALGAEDDVITAGTTYDRNLVLHGARFWYLLNGRQTFTPANASLMTGSAYKEANTAPPVSSGNYSFYAKYNNAGGSPVSYMYQVQAGLVADDPESYEISQQLDSYLQGKPVEILAVESPNLVLLRTDAYRNGVYVYGYLDQSGQQRILDNWQKWAWSEGVGYTIGMSPDGTDMLVYLIREGAGQVWVAAERIVLRSTLSDCPYLDSLRLYSSIGGSIVGADDACVAYGLGSRRLLGATLADASDLTSAFGSDNLWVGHSYEAYVTPTNPFVRDNNDRAILGGRLTLGAIDVSLASSGGCTVTVNTAAGTRTALDFSGRLLGRASSVIGAQPIVDTTVSASVYKEVRECSYTIAAKKWLPMTITAIEWVGQWFFNTRRV